MLTTTRRHFTVHIIQNIKSTLRLEFNQPLTKTLKNKKKMISSESLKIQIQSHQKIRLSPLILKVGPTRPGHKRKRSFVFRI